MIFQAHRDDPKADRRESPAPKGGERPQQG